MSTRACNACEWRGLTIRMCGSVGPLCPECGETTELVRTPTVDALTSRWVDDSSVRSAVTICMQHRRWVLVLSNGFTRPLAPLEVWAWVALRVPV